VTWSWSALTVDGTVPGAAGCMGRSVRVEWMVPFFAFCGFVAAQDVDQGAREESLVTTS
jgi:hypothetical protein